MTLKRRTASRAIARAIPFSHGTASFSSAFLIFLSVACMGVSAFRPQVFDGARESAAGLFSPLLATVSQPFQQAALVVRDVSGLAELQATNARLEQENARLREWYQTALLLNAENKSLRDLLNIKLDSNLEYVTARIIADSGNTYVKSFIISAGKLEGVDRGQAVLSGDGLVGRIVEAEEGSSRVLLVTDMNSRVPVMVEDTMQHAIMSGMNSDQPKLIHMLQDSDIVQGARIVTSGHGGIYPQGLPVGRVVVDERGDKRVELFAHIAQMQHVRIVREGDDPNLIRHSSSTE